MQELMSRHKAYSLNPRDCLKTTLFQKWQRMVAPPGKRGTLLTINFKLFSKGWISWILLLLTRNKFWRKELKAFELILYLSALLLFKNEITGPIRRSFFNLIWKWFSRKSLNLLHIFLTFSLYVVLIFVSYDRCTKTT